MGSTMCGARVSLRQPLTCCASCSSCRLLLLSLLSSSMDGDKLSTQVYGEDDQLTFLLWPVVDDALGRQGCYCVSQRGSAGSQGKSHVRICHNVRHN
ncbi:hypothetical protein LZ30DRAFT_719249 [Colletotrichum cereale]|nr:hypothetical protein LZ30DRAFT_719249 [Colletotrichum cereale]